MLDFLALGGREGVEPLAHLGTPFTCGLACPAMRASSLARPEAPKMSLITEDSLIWASSSSFSARCFSRVRSWVKVRR